ncbi:MAG: holo-ACP synthase [Aquabacterium sp.]|nr:holo-ACP synthase [Aquabacterium sp.]
MAQFPALPVFPASFAANAVPSSQVGAGIDIVLISRIQDSIDRFGDRFLNRVFTQDEQTYAQSSQALQAERLAARFAAKEATLKALSMADKGIAWREMEVFRHADGRCDLHLHGKAAEHARQHNVTQIALSLSHDGGYAAAIVVAVTVGAA